jgi:phosphoglucosamine mutase
MLRTPVGDKYVAAEIAEHDYSIGGEQSGHVIFSDYLFTGDGLGTALNVLQVMAATGRELRDLGIGLVRTPVGDKYVMEELLRDNLSLGGEQSGHVIFPDFLYTGDGIVTALNVVRVMAETGRPLADLAGELRTYPQVLLNLRVRERRDWMTMPAAAQAIRDVETRLAGRGRLLVRYSGTEPLLRVMIEGERQDEIDAWAAQIVAAVRTEIGE